MSTNCLFSLLKGVSSVILKLEVVCLRKCDHLFFLGHDVVSSIEQGREMYYRPEQVVRQIEEKQETGNLVSSLKIKQNKKLTYVFYLKDYIERLKQGVKSAILIESPESLYDPYDFIFALLDKLSKTSLEVGFVFWGRLKEPIHLVQSEKIFYSRNLDEYLLWMKEKQIEKKLEHCLLENTMTFTR